jgi:prepilin-type N-terminal cleavage/methylation domain-containing protein
MNIKQMKQTISKFRAADVSVIKDDALRVKAQKLQAKQGGFTLLELLVVITLLATLAVGALVAYENIGDNAEAVAAANAAATIDSAIRTYRAVESAYPNQWDSLVLNNDASGAVVSFVAAPTRSFIGTWAVSDASTAGIASDIAEALEAVGIEEIQYINSASTGTAGDPAVVNLAHNESNYAAAQEVELEDGLPTHFSVVPNGACNAGSANYPDTTLATGATPISDNSIQNAISDILEGDDCHAVIALGFGSDSASSTSFSNVAISQSPQYVRSTNDDATEINPQVDYARFIGLFHVAESEDNGATWVVNDRARLLAIVAPDGKKIDELVADMQPE